MRINKRSTQFHQSLNLDCRRITTYGPRQANLVLIAYASSEGSGEKKHGNKSLKMKGTRDQWQLNTGNRFFLGTGEESDLFEGLGWP